MNYNRRTLEELNVMDDFLMNRLAEDKAVGEAFCRRLLTVLLQKKLGRIHVRTQNVLPALTPQMRGIRLDVQVDELEETGEKDGAAANVYDIEPHISNDLDLARHNRFYQAKIDSRGLKSGERDFKRLPNLYVLTILNYDPFGYDYMVYHVHNKCEEVPELVYDDGLSFFYFYTDGKRGGSPQMGRLLQYIKDSREQNVTDDATKEIHTYVERIKIQPEVEVAYMRFGDIIDLERREAAQEAALDARIQDILELLEEYGEVPDNVRKLVEDAEDADTLKNWLKLAARVDSIQEFEDKICRASEKNQSDKEE